MDDRDLPPRQTRPPTRRAAAAPARTRRGRLRALRDEVERRGHVVDLAQVEEAGVAASTFVDLARAAGWRQPFPRVWVPPHVPIDGRVAARAALASVGAPAWLGRATVLWLLGLVPTPPPDVQVVVPAPRRLKRVDGISLLRTRTLRPDEVVTVAGFPATGLARSLRDLTAIWPVDQLRPVALDALQSRKLRLEDLREQRRRMGRGSTGAHLMNALIADLERDGSDSTLEWDVRDALQRLPFYAFPRPMPWLAPDGVVDHLDIAFPAQWTVIFCDSRAHHGHGTTFTTDRRAWNSVAGLWRPFWVDSTILRDSMDDFVDAVTAELLAAPRERPPAKAHPCRCRGCLAARS